EAMTTATLDALVIGQSPEAFRAIAVELFGDTEGRSGTAREAPSAGSGPEGTASAEPEGGALPAAPQNTEGA
ncbi:hypothetical protein V5F77_29325, partial [Xanthobacter sp. DSM 24535]|uniref:hypothetical protein n=1 Tax=Roseixanthobacter psychrophilus TaxID=3119917 RepID=UPI00372CAC56